MVLRSTWEWSGRARRVSFLRNAESLVPEFAGRADRRTCSRTSFISGRVTIAQARGYAVVVPGSYGQNGSVPRASPV
jgi:hypothetical protein